MECNAFERLHTLSLPTQQSISLDTTHTRNTTREPALLKEGNRCTEMLCLCSKRQGCYDRMSNRYTFNSKSLNKQTLEDGGDGLMSKYRRELDEPLNVTSTIKRFRTAQHSSATYEQTEKGLSYFYPKRNVEDGLPTQPIQLCSIT